MEDNVENRSSRLSNNKKEMFKDSEELLIENPDPIPLVVDPPNDNSLRNYKDYLLPLGKNREASNLTTNVYIPITNNNYNRNRFKPIHPNRINFKSQSEYFFKACRDGKTEIVRKVLSHQADPGKLLNDTDKEGMTPLHVAVRFNHVDTVKLLIEYGANVNSCQNNGVTPLHIAARYTMGESNTLMTINPFECNVEIERKGFSKFFTHKKFRDNNEPCPTDINYHVSERTSHPNYYLVDNKSTSTKYPCGKQKSKIEASNLKASSGLTTTTMEMDLIADKREFPTTISRSNSVILTQNKSKNDIEYSKSIILLLLMARANINATDLNDSTPLHYAAMRGNSLAVSELLSHPYINIESKDRMWMTAMHHAAERGSVNVANLLIKKGANLRCLDVAGMTPLHIAAEEGHYPFCKLLIDTFALSVSRLQASNLCNALNRNNETPLFFAASAGRHDIVSLLLENGSLIIPTEDCMTTPIHLACASGSLETIKLLLNANKLLVESRNCNDETPLHSAASLNQENIVEYLIQLGCDVNCVDKDVETPLISASKRDNVNIVRMLVENGAKLMPKDINDYTCIHWCSINNSLNCAEYLTSIEEYNQLLQSSIDIHENTALHLAAQFGLYDMCLLLLNADTTGLLMNSKNDQGYTPMLLATKYGHCKVVELFLDISPALLMDNDDTDNTALHLSANAGHVGVTKLLLQKGSFVDSKNSHQQTPLELSICNGHIKVTKIIINYDPIIDPSDRNHLSSLMLACKLGHCEIVQLLLQSGADVLRIDNHRRNCLDIAIDEKQRSVAITLLKSTYWKDLLRNVSVSPDMNYMTSPMRKLIKKMPDVAELVFDRCITNNGLPENHPKYEIFLDYEFLEDIATEWGCDLPGSYYNKMYKNTVKSIPYKLDTKYTNDASQSNNKPSISINNNNDNVKVSFKEKFNKTLSNFFNRKETKSYSIHPLLLMVKKERVILLCHPLVSYLLSHKWKKYGRHVYYIRFFFFLIYLIFLTGYSLTVDSYTREEYVGSNPPKNISSCYDTKLDLNHYLSGVFVTFGTIFLFSLAFINTTIKVIKFILEYRSICFSEIFDLAASIVTMYYVSGTFHVYGHISINPSYRCSTAYRSIGAISMWMSYLSFVLLMRKLPKVGIYVVMYTDIFRTFMQFAPVYIIIILSYGFSFYLLFQDRTDVYAYITPQRSIVKTLLGTVSEIEYDTFYNDKNYSPLKLSWLLLIAFVVTNTLILMNLLVGLAVDDIQGVQSKAVLKRLALQVDLALGIEFLLPSHIRVRSNRLGERVKPNRINGRWNFWSLWEFNIDPKKIANVNAKNTQQFPLDINQNDKNTSKSIKSRLTKLENQCNRIEGMIATILEYQGLHIDSDRQPIVQ